MSSLDVSANASVGLAAGVSGSLTVSPASPKLETETEHLLSAFNFSVEIDVHGVSGTICNAAFSDCDGLELTHEVKTIREGGNNRAQIRLSGPASFGTVTLKRGMTPNANLWEWFGAVIADPSLRANGEVVIFARAQGTKRASFLLERCVPVKLKAPPLNARDGALAIEELQLACESIRLKGASGA